MTLRVLLGGVLGGIAIFMWGFVFWAVLPFAKDNLPELPNIAAVARSLDAAIPESGTYLFPSREGASDMKERYAEGPVGMIVFRKGGVDIEDPMIYLKGLVHFMACAAIAGGIMSTVIGSLKTYGSRVLFVFRLGLFAGVAVNVAKAIWWHAPTDFLFLDCAFHFVGWGVAGFAIAAVVKPKAGALPTI
jgi:hypothetical protein